MTLAAVDLDDLRWEDMIAAARRRIAAVSDGAWTLHAPVDPGITLLELFAWLLEQRIYWLDQVPDTMTRALLSLLGDAPRGARPAATVLTLEDMTTPRRPALAVAAGERARLRRRRKSDLVFTLESDLAVLPVTGPIRVRVDGADASADLRSGNPVDLFPRAGAPGEVELIVPLDDPATWAGQTLALLLELEVPGAIRPSWHPDATEGVEPASALTWWYSSSAGWTRWDDAIVYPQDRGADTGDQTGGLRRSGLVRLPVPADWAPAPIGGGYGLMIRTAEPRFSEPPRLRAVQINAVRARHRYKHTIDHTLDWLPLPGRELALPADQPALIDTIRIFIEEQGRSRQKWEPAADFTFHGPGDRVFVGDREHRRITFGDGLTGRVPVVDPNASPNVTVNLVLGGGTEGNVGGHALGWHAADAELRVENPVGAVGGRDPEPLDRARQRVGAALRTRHRAISRADYRELAETTPGVAIRRAHPAIGYHPDHPCAVVPGAVTVFVIPEITRGPDARPSTVVPDPGALAAVRARLDEARLLGTEVYVSAPLYREVAVGVTVAAAPADPQEMRRRLTAALARYLDPLVGGDGEDGWPFGEPVRPSALVRVLGAELAGDGEILEVRVSLDGVAPIDWCLDVAVGEHRLPVLAAVSVTLESPGATTGGLR